MKPNDIYHDLIGQPFTDEVLESLGDVRVIEPGYGYTTDYQPFRLNVHVDKHGIITEFTHG